MSMDLYSKGNSSSEWYDEVEAYANGGPESDPEVADFLSFVATGHKNPGFRRALATQIYLSVPVSGSAHRVLNIVPSSKGNISALEASSVGKEGARRAEQAVRSAHRWMWLVLAIFSTLWGVAAGISFVAGIGLDVRLALFGVLGNIVLALSLFRLGRATGWADR